MHLYTKNIPRQLYKTLLTASTMYKRGLFAPFQFRCPFSPVAAGTSRCPSSQRQVRLPPRSGTALRAAQPFAPVIDWASPSTFFSFFLPVFGWGRRPGEGKSPAGRIQGAPELPPPSPSSGFPLPEALCTQRARFCLSIRGHGDLRGDPIPPEGTITATFPPIKAFGTARTCRGEVAIGIPGSASGVSPRRDGPGREKQCGDAEGPALPGPARPGGSGSRPRPLRLSSSFRSALPGPAAPSLPATADTPRPLRRATRDFMKKRRRGKSRNFLFGIEEGKKKSRAFGHLLCVSTGGEPGPAGA
ncbi:uncharacterized protein LOC134552500 [Prinia subflava]|uniref:uncharacterized protein LOC134552500 n=1 Tax=Prinia subflava TaxID=208062 RepID=UPI002FE0141C